MQEAQEEFLGLLPTTPALGRALEFRRRLLPFILTNFIFKWPNAKCQQ